jgi:uncharacterized membrane protein YfcA
MGCRPDTGLALAGRDPHAGAVLAAILLATLIAGTSYQVNRKVDYRAVRALLPSSACGPDADI